MALVKFTIYGDTISKANNRRLITVRGMPRFILSKRAVEYLAKFESQCVVLPQKLEGDLGADIDIFYGSKRPDLDESLILDAMQGKIYDNDRQIKVKNIRWHLDRALPRAFIQVWELAGNERPERDVVAPGPDHSPKGPEQQKPEAPKRRRKLGDDA
jgi:hypothetical protein